MTALEVLDGAAVRRWYRLAANALAQARAAIDALNVFPVPDADTGTNLQLTLTSAAEAVEALPDGASPAEIWQAAGAAIEAGMRAGRPHRITVTYLGTPAPGGRGVIAIADGDGPASLLRAAGARVIRQEDGTGPAAPALIAAIRQAGPEVIILPNGAHVAALACSVAARLADEGMAVAVIPSRSPLQALAAMAVHDPARSHDADVAAMGRAAAGTRYGSVVRRGDSVAGLVADEVAVTGADAGQVALRVAEALMAEGGELVTLMASDDVGPPLPQAVGAQLAQAWPGIEVVYYGGGPVPLLIGVE